LSYNNINDGAAALEVVKSIRKLAQSSGDGVGACVVKHTNPCGAALAPGATDAIDAALAGDPTAAYGGILALSAVLDTQAAERICREGVFLELVIAPEFTDEALRVLSARWANVRLLAVGDRGATASRKLDYRSIPGGMLVQDRDARASTPWQWEHKAGPVPSTEQLEDAAFLETVCRYVTSNAVVIGGPDRTSRARLTRLFGVGSGQVDRVSACRLAVEKAGGLAAGAIAVGDAFFPFSDGPQVLADAGVTMIVHPGGSKRDQETFDLCGERGITCMVTGVRHFRH
jgi:phosphoribosylaminoimidazolecarboxamide formyltransferase/IMP cyclohydrolase